MLGPLVRRLSYNPVLAAIVRRLRLQGAARRAYHRLFRGPDGVIELRCGEVTAQFHAPDAQEFRTVELAMLSEERTITAVLSALRPGDVFWDVGSNRGLFAVFAAKRVGPQGVVIAFEPQRSSYARLVANVDLNRLDNVRPLRCALSDREGVGALAPAPSGDLSQACRLVEHRREDTEAVQLTTGDSLDVPPPDVVKVDVEGHEYPAIRGAEHVLSRRACRALFCEVHPDRQPAGVTADAVADLIASLGFKDVRGDRRGREVQMVGVKGRSEADA